ncbi:unnamed protein product [Scytosiphon promiscuus]
MPDVVKPGPGGGGNDEEEEENQDVTMDLMGNSRDFPLQVLMLVLLLLGWLQANGLPLCHC